MQTVQMTRDEIDARTGRFEKLQPMEFMKNDTTVSQAVKDIILARKLMPAVDPNALEVFKIKMGPRFDAGPEA